MSILPTSKDRSAADLAILAITATVCVFLIVSLVAVVIIELVHPESDIKGFTNIISQSISVLVGAVVGFISGRGYEVSKQEPYDEQEGPL